MNNYNTLFGQLLSQVKRPEFDKLCKTMESDKFRKDFNTWDQSMLPKRGVPSKCPVPMARRRSLPLFAVCRGVGIPSLVNERVDGQPAVGDLEFHQRVVLMRAFDDAEEFVVLCVIVRDALKRVVRDDHVFLVFVPDDLEIPGSLVIVHGVLDIILSEYGVVGERDASGQNA